MEQIKKILSENDAETMETLKTIFTKGDKVTITSDEGEFSIQQSIAQSGMVDEANEDQIKQEKQLMEYQTYVNFNPKKFKAAATLLEANFSVQPSIALSGVVEENN